MQVRAAITFYSTDILHICTIIIISYPRNLVKWITLNRGKIFKEQFRIRPR